MKKKLKQQVKSYTKKALGFINNYLDKDEFNFDHISYQTTSKEDYKKAIEQFKKYGKLINEIPHAGRRLGIIKLKDPINIDHITIDRVEISEPKPKSNVDKRKLDHCSFYLTKDYESEIQRLKDQGLEIVDQKQIEDDKFSKIIYENIEVELRNNQLGGNRKQSKSNKSKQQSDLVNKLKEELEAQKEKKLQALADYQNLQKRIDKERAKTRTLATVNILKNVIDVSEDFERLIEKTDISNEIEGIQLIQDKLDDILERNNIVKIDAKIGDKFDEDIHEAIGVREVKDEKKANTIIQIVQKGYKIKNTDMIVKPLLVLVGKK